MPLNQLPQKISSSQLNDLYCIEALKWDTFFKGKLSFDASMLQKFTPMIAWADKNFPGQNSNHTIIKELFLKQACRFLGKKVSLSLDNFKKELTHRGVSLYPKAASALSRVPSDPAIITKAAENFRSKYYGRLFQMPQKKPEQTIHPRPILYSRSF